jgi:hypothetical protein
VGPTSSGRLRLDATRHECEYGEGTALFDAIEAYASHADVGPGQPEWSC